ncbi:hypothetical protein B4U79_08704 [Dinothrombium tinctorium]|uniref:Uncharacterized protein n=1 Tax=Dinothrombium tinctorium TaxID=1965070 RepID=A0A443Q6C9_9ACAR|nr:hypothetical protein B4U79_08704 [Dinothrombium tinctorium]
MAIDALSRRTIQ